jgi:D-glycero-beta-D-manno-heptose-7-phosphate kinase
MSRELLDRFEDARVLVIGDLMLDEYVWGDVRRISPEAPVPVVEVRGRTQVPGGAGNTAAGVVALGSTALLAGVVGDDEPGALLLTTLESAGIVCEGIQTIPGRATTTKTRVIAHSQQVVRTDSEERAPLPSVFEDALLVWAEAEIGETGAIILSDYAKGVVSERVAQEVIGLASAHGRPVIVDPKGHDYVKYRGATVITPNVHEAERAAHHPVETDHDLRVVAQRLSDTLGGTALLVTRGADGMTLFGAGDVLDIAAEAQDVYDVTGAGDTVAAVLAASLAAGASLEVAVALANTAAGIAVSKVGTTPVNIAELRQRAS